MIQFFKIANQRFVHAMKHDEAFWIHVESPSEDEIKILHERYGLDEDFIDDLQDTDENSRMEYDEGTILTILRVPLYYRHRSANLSFTTAPMGIICTPEKIFTICFYENEIVSQYLDGKHRPFAITQQSFLLQIALRTATYFLKFLKEINRRITKIENELHQSLRNKELIQLLTMEKSLVYFSTSLKSNEIILERMQRSRWLHLDPEADDLVEDVIIENKQAIEMTSIHTSILSGTMDTFASMISNNLNVRIKFLTSVTIVLMLPTLIASIYGMNIILPIQHNRYAFSILMGISIVASILLVLFLIRRKLF